jgi:hypothetical protein
LWMSWQLWEAWITRTLWDLKVFLNLRIQFTS